MKKQYEPLTSLSLGFDTLAYVDSNGFDKDAMQKGGSLGLPKEYEATFPYVKGFTLEDTKMTLVVKGQAARLYYPTPGVARDTDVIPSRQSQKVTAVWSFDIGSYSGGNVGTFGSFSFS